MIAFYILVYISHSNMRSVKAPLKLVYVLKCFYLRVCFHLCRFQTWVVPLSPCSSCPSSSCSSRSGPAWPAAGVARRPTSPAPPSSCCSQVSYLLRNWTESLFNLRDMPACTCGVWEKINAGVQLTLAGERRKMSLSKDTHLINYILLHNACALFERIASLARDHEIYCFFINMI